MNITKVLLWVLLGFMYYMNYLGAATNKLWVKISELGVIFPFSFMPPAWVFMLSWASIFIGLLIWYFVIVCKKNALSCKELQLFFISMILNITWLIMSWLWFTVVSVIVLAALWVTIAMMIVSQNSKSTHHSLTSIVWWIYFWWILIATVVIWFSQIVYVYNPVFALWETWMYSIILWAFLSIIISYRILWNIYALMWSMFILTACLIKLM